jgi:hypothetical protein
VDCIPLHPDWRESQDELMAKYRRLTGLLDAAAAKVDAA